MRGSPARSIEPAPGARHVGDDPAACTARRYWPRAAHSRREQEAKAAARPITRRRSMQLQAWAPPVASQDAPRGPGPASSSLEDVLAPIQNSAGRPMGRRRGSDASRAVPSRRGAGDNGRSGCRAQVPPTDAMGVNGRRRAYTGRDPTRLEQDQSKYRSACHRRHECNPGQTGSNSNNLAIGFFGWGNISARTSSQSISAPQWMP